EVGLSNDAEEDGRAQSDRNDGGTALPDRIEPVEQHEQDGERGEGHREVQEDERPARSALEPAAADVVQLGRRQPRVGDENLDGDERVERPDEADLRHGRALERLRRHESPRGARPLPNQTTSAAAASNAATSSGGPRPCGHSTARRERLAGGGWAAESR